MSDFIYHGVPLESNEMRFYATDVEKKMYNSIEYDTSYNPEQMYELYCSDGSKMYVHRILWDAWGLRQPLSNKSNELNSRNKYHSRNVLEIFVQFLYNKSFKDTARLLSLSETDYTSALETFHGIVTTYSDSFYGVMWHLHKHYAELHCDIIDIIYAKGLPEFDWNNIAISRMIQNEIFKISQNEERTKKGTLKTLENFQYNFKFVDEWNVRPFELGSVALDVCKSVKIGKTAQKIETKILYCSYKSLSMSTEVVEHSCNDDDYLMARKPSYNDLYTLLLQLNLRVSHASKLLRNKIRILNLNVELSTQNSLLNVNDTSAIVKIVPNSTHNMINAQMNKKNQDLFVMFINDKNKNIITPENMYNNPDIVYIPYACLLTLYPSIFSKNRFNFIVGQSLGNLPLTDKENTSTPLSVELTNSLDRRKVFYYDDAAKNKFIWQFVVSVDDTIVLYCIKCLLFGVKMDFMCQKASLENIIAAMNIICKMSPNFYYPNHHKHIDHAFKKALEQYNLKSTKIISDYSSSPYIYWLLKTYKKIYKRVDMIHKGFDLSMYHKWVSNYKGSLRDTSILILKTYLEFTMHRGIEKDSLPPGLCSFAIIDPSLSIVAFIYLNENTMYNHYNSIQCESSRLTKKNFQLYKVPPLKSQSIDIHSVDTQQTTDNILCTWKMQLNHPILCNNLLKGIFDFNIHNLMEKLVIFIDHFLFPKQKEHQQTSDPIWKNKRDRAVSYEKLHHFAAVSIGHFLNYIYKKVERLLRNCSTQGEAPQIILAREDVEDMRSRSKEYGIPFHMAWKKDSMCHIHLEYSDNDVFKEYSTHIWMNVKYNNLYSKNDLSTPIPITGTTYNHLFQACSFLSHYSWYPQLSSKKPFGLISTHENNMIGDSVKKAIPKVSKMGEKYVKSVLADCYRDYITGHMMGASIIDLHASNLIWSNVIFPVMACNVVR